MKNFIIIIITVLASCGTIKQEKVITVPVDVRSEASPLEGHDTPYKPLSEFNLDTLKYVQANFLHRNGAYANKSFDVLLNDLEIPIIAFGAGVSGENIKLSESISLRFFKESDINSKAADHKNPIILVIEWKTPLPTEEVFSLLRKSQNVWNKDVQQYFSNKIIANIEMVK